MPVYIFGSGDCGQLGMGEACTTATKPKQMPYFADKHIVSVAAGGLHSLALDANGEVP